MARVPIQVGHSADPDDAFMVWALEAGKVDTRGLDLRARRLGHPDAERLGGRGPARGDGALRRRLPGSRRPLRRCSPTARRSARATGRSSSRAASSRSTSCARSRSSRPGRLTTASRVLRLALGDGIRTRDLPFDHVLEEVTSGRAEAGLLIHEGQLTFAEAGLHKLLDLGVWWQAEMELPLPLGVVAARRDLDAARRRLGGPARVDRGRVSRTATRRSRTR